MKEKNNDLKLWLIICAVILGVIVLAGVISALCGADPIAMFEDIAGMSGWWLAGAAVLIAAGFVGCESAVAEAFGAARSERGNLLTEKDSYRTAIPKVFAAGDARRGQSLVVWAIAEGKACADEVDRSLI